MDGDVGTGQSRKTRPPADEGPYEWFCPLYERVIPEGLCVDINYERLGYIKGDSLAELEKTRGKTASEVNRACEQCPNFPFRDS